MTRGRVQEVLDLTFACLGEMNLFKAEVRSLYRVACGFTFLVAESNLDWIFPELNREARGTEKGLYCFVVVDLFLCMNLSNSWNVSSDSPPPKNSIPS
ncbi:MAG: hypothetical protein NVSMB9_18950 [Isosphaeraceae bacterium]